MLCFKSSYFLSSHLNRYEDERERDYGSDDGDEIEEWFQSAVRVVAGDDGDNEHDDCYVVESKEVNVGYDGEEGDQINDSYYEDIESDPEYVSDDDNEIEEERAG